MKKSFAEWMSKKITYQGVPLSGGQWYRHLTVNYPDRTDLDNPDRMIDASIGVVAHESWPQQIDEKEFIKELYAISFVDAIHEVMESIKIDSKHPLSPHFNNVQTETKGWDLLTDIANTAAERLMKDYPK